MDNAARVTNAASHDDRHAYRGSTLVENVTSPQHRPMTVAERQTKSRQLRKARQAAQAEREPLLYTSDEWRQFCDSDALSRKAGANWETMPAMVLRELADNAADAADGAGAWLESVTVDGDPWWCIGDYGNGIAPDEVARVFSVNRPMQSTKHVRRPTRGMLGNGTRVVAGYCAIERLPIMVESRDRQTVLRVEKATGHTVIVQQLPIEPVTGTRVYLPKIDGLAGPSVADLAQKTLALATPAADTRVYNGPSNPWWYGTADLARLLVTAPAGTSIGTVVRDMGLRLPHGVPDGLAAEVTEERAAALLTALRERYKPLPEERIGRVGRDAFGNQYQGYAIEHFRATFYTSGATVPLTVEVWARCDGWKRRDMLVTADIDTYLNRSAVMCGVGAMGRSERVRLHGAGIHGYYVAAKPGRYRVVVSIITPQAKLLSDGKAPDLAYAAEELSKAIGSAMKQARRGVPPDDATPEEIAAAEAEAKADKQAKEADAMRRDQRRQQREADQAAWRSIGGARVLLRTIEAEAEAAGVSVNDLSVGGAQSDPFRMDTPPNHRIGRWLADHMPTDRKIHLRGLHYLLVSTTGLIRPDGRAYRNDLPSWQWLQGALNAARWLGYVRFDQIDDERNTEPAWAPASDPATAPRIAIDNPPLPDLPDMPELVPAMSLEWDGSADRQKFHLCLLGEKTGLRPVLAPLAEEFGADLLLPSGEPSITMLDRLVKRAIADGRPLVILCFTDCDPTGYGIPASVARKVQAMLALAGSDLHARVIPAGLTVEQARDLDLPSMPLKKKETRAAVWQALTGRGQTEIDALLALRPEVLVQIARDAIEPFYDTGLAKRAREARREWEDEARRILSATLDQMPGYRAAMERFEQQHAAYAEAHAAVSVAVSDLHAAMQQAIERAALPDMPALPEWTAPDVPIPGALFDSADGFVANARRLQQAKLRNVAADDDEDE